MISGFWKARPRVVTREFDRPLEGDENFNLYAIDPTVSADPASGVPAACPLTDLKGVRVVPYAVPRVSRISCLIGLNNRNPCHHDLYELHVSTGEKVLVKKNTDQISGWVSDNVLHLTPAGDGSDGVDGSD